MHSNLFLLYDIDIICSIVVSPLPRAVPSGRPGRDGGQIKLVWLLTRKLPEL